MVVPLANSTSTSKAQRTPSEAGYILIGVLILVALFVIALAVAAPIVAKDIERDKEVETVQRGKQYARAIKLYYKRFGAYPGSLKQLENTNNIRYLRKRYLDPITGKDDWRIIHVGQAKVPPMGFFGQPLAAGQGTASTGLLGNGSGGVSSAGNANAFGNSGSSSFGNSFNSSGGFGSTTNTGDGGAIAGGGLNGPAGTTGTGVGGGLNGSTTLGAGSTGAGGTGFDGGGPIVGVGLPVTKKSIVVYHKQDAFNKWEFTYDPLQDQVMLSNSNGAGGGTPVGTPIGGTPGQTGTTPGTTNSSPFSNNNNGGASTNTPATGTGDSPNNQ